MTEQDKCAKCGKTAKGPLVVTQDDFYCASCAGSVSPTAIAMLGRTREKMKASPETVQSWNRRYTSSDIHGQPHKCMSCHQNPHHLVRHERRTLCIPCAFTAWPTEMETMIDDLH